MTPPALHVSLDVPLPKEVAVGRGSALFVAGTCFCRDGRIASLDRAAQAAEARSAAVVRITPSAAPVQDAPAQASGRTLSVLATGYSLSGSTATGLPVGWGVVAVDPSVIPLGTRLSIPGYGEGVAADVGGAVQGAATDLWFPSQAQARAWGRRAVTITVH